MSSSECSFCRSQIESVELRAEAGHWAVAEPSTLEDVRVQFPSATEPGYVVRFVLQEAGGTVLSTEGVVEEWPGQTYPNYAVVLEWLGDRFVVMAVDSDTSE